MRRLFSLLPILMSFGCWADYAPVSEPFWKSLAAPWESSQWDTALQVANRQWSRSKTGTLERAEAQLALGMTFRKMKMPFSAQILLSQVVTSGLGTDVGWEALKEIDQLVRTEPIDSESAIRQLVLEVDLDAPPGEVADFVYYHRGTKNRQAGFTKWAEEDLKKINVDSYWGYRVQYQEALAMVAAGKNDEAAQAFRAFTVKEGMPLQLQQDSWHQLARLLFEKGDFEKAYEIFVKVQIRPRERGAILLERAWSKYYLKDFSKALGLLTALEAPVFDSSRSPEVYLLKMLIYKELCHFDSVAESLAEFNLRFKPSIDLIRKRGILSDDRSLSLLAALERGMQGSVDSFNQVRREQKEFASQKFKRFGSLTELAKEYPLQTKRLKENLDYALKDKLVLASEKLLDWFEQISFLDYQSRIDQLRMGKGNKNKEDVATSEKNKVAWQFAGEFWLDEIEDLRVDVVNQCGGSK